MPTKTSLQNKHFGNGDYFVTIDHFHKWLRLSYSFVFMLIRPTRLFLVKIFFRILRMGVRLIRLINIKTKEY